MLVILQRDFPDKYAGLVNQDSRILGWVKEIDEGRNANSIRSDIAKHIMTEAGIMEVYGVSQEDAQKLIQGKAGGGLNFSDLGAKTEALPRNAILTRVGNEYRVVWDIGDGLGHAWYKISSEQLKDIYGTETPEINFNFSNVKMPNAYIVDDGKHFQQFFSVRQ